MVPGLEPATFGPKLQVTSGEGMDADTDGDADEEEKSNDILLKGPALHKWCAWGADESFDPTIQENLEITPERPELGPVRTPVSDLGGRMGPARWFLEPPVDI